MNQGAAIYGVSYDLPENNSDWVDLMGFEFALLSDPGHVWGRAMGVEREPEEKLYPLPRRVTFLVDSEGVIRWTYLVPREEVSSHADLTLAELRRLMAGV